MVDFRNYLIQSQEDFPQRQKHNEIVNLSSLQERKPLPARRTEQITTGAMEGFSRENPSVRRSRGFEPTVFPAIQEAAKKVSQIDYGLLKKELTKSDQAIILMDYNRAQLESNLAMLEDLPSVRSQENGKKASRGQAVTGKSASHQKINKHLQQQVRVVSSDQKLGLEKKEKSKQKQKKKSGLHKNISGIIAQEANDIRLIQASQERE